MRIAFLSLVTVCSVVFSAEPETKTAQLTAKAERALKAEFRQCLATCGSSPRAECIESCELDCSARAYDEQGVLSASVCER